MLVRRNCGELNIYETCTRQLNNIHGGGKPEGIWVLTVTPEKVITLPHPIRALASVWLEM